MDDFDLYDENGDPVQWGVDGFYNVSSGVTRMSGPCVGIVLSIEPADSESNLLYKFLTGDSGGKQQASYVEAEVLLIYGGQELYTPLSNVIVLPWGKCSNQGPGEDEPADWSEDVPNGCSASQLAEYRKADTRLNVDQLDGDWVIVDFLGGILQCPVIMSWFQNPLNKRDASTKEKGRQFILRRNNSEFGIDKNGDFHLTHRVGQYLQMKGEQISIKHRKGQLIHLDEDGDVTITSGEGEDVTSVMVKGDGFVVNNGKTTVQVKGNDLLIKTTSGKTTIAAQEVNMMASKVVASAGNQVDALCREQLGFDFKNTFAAFYAIINLLSQVSSSPPLTPIKAALEAMIKGYGLDDIATRLGVLFPLPTPKGLDENVIGQYMTKILKGE